MDLFHFLEWKYPMKAKGRKHVIYQSSFLSQYLHLALGSAIHQAHNYCHPPPPPETVLSLSKNQPSSGLFSSKWHFLWRQKTCEESWLDFTSGWSSSRNERDTAPWMRINCAGYDPEKSLPAALVARADTHLPALSSF